MGSTYVDILFCQDAARYKELLQKELSKIHYYIRLKEISSFSDISTDHFDTILLIISQKMLDIVRQGNNFTLDKVLSTRQNRFYCVVENIPQHNYEGLLDSGQSTVSWLKVDLKNPNCRARFCEIQQTALHDDLNKGSGRPRPKRKGLFSIIPNSFQCGKGLDNEGMIIIDDVSSLTRLRWKFRGETVKAFVILKDGSMCNIPLTPVIPSRAYRFNLPEAVLSEISKHMVYVHDIHGSEKNSLGNRSLTVKSELQFINSNLFTKSNLCRMARIPNTENQTSFDRQELDRRLTSEYELKRLPLCLPMQDNMVTDKGNDPSLLHVACRYGLIALMESLLADPSLSFDLLDNIVYLKDFDDMNCFDIARSNGFLSVTEPLRKRLAVDSPYVPNNKPGYVFSARVDENQKHFDDVYSPKEYVRSESHGSGADDSYVTNATVENDGAPAQDHNGFSSRKRENLKKQSSTPYFNIPHRRASSERRIQGNSVESGEDDDDSLQNDISYFQPSTSFAEDEEIDGEAEDYENVPAVQPPAVTIRKGTINNRN